MNAGPGHVQLFDRHVRRADSQNFSGLVEELSGQPPRTVYFCNVHMLMLSQSDQELAQGMDATDWVLADSAPVAWLQRRVSGLPAAVIPGYQVLLAICDRAVRAGEGVGFYGSEPIVRERLVDHLQARFPGLQITYDDSPPYMSGNLVTSAEEIHRIAGAGIRWLFVGLGCPKQEKWAARYGPALDCHVLAVGAAFDWLAGTTRKPPDWTEKAGLAWLWRLAQNPRRMWHRYLIYNTKFVLKSAKLLTWDLLFNRQGSAGTP